MILATHGIIGSSIVSVDTDAQAFITATGITDTTQKSAINTLVTDLKSYGLWTKMKAIYPFVGGTALTHKFNLKDPRDLNVAFRLNFIGGGTHSSGGYQLNGSNSWADAFINPSIDLTTNSVSIGHYSRTNRIGMKKIAIGAWQNSIVSGLMIYPRYTDNKALIGTSDDTNGNTPLVSTTLGFWQGSRVNATQTLSNINNTNYTYTYAAKALPNSTTYIGSIPYFAGTYVDVLQLAFAYVGYGLSTTDLSNYYSAVQSYQTTLSRQV